MSNDLGLLHRLTKCLVHEGSDVTFLILFCEQHIANLAGNKTLVFFVPAFNVINGGSHAGNKLAMQASLFSTCTKFLHIGRSFRELLT